MQQDISHKTNKQKQKMPDHLYCVYFNIFEVLVCCLGSVRQFPDSQTKHAGGHGNEGMHCLIRCRAVSEQEK